MAVIISKVWLFLKKIKDWDYLLDKQNIIASIDTLSIEYNIKN